MKHYLDLIPISSKLHKKQNFMSICCIILSVFLVTTIFGMADMFIRSQVMKAQEEKGNWHIMIENISDEMAAILSKRPEIKRVSRYSILNQRGNEDYILNGDKVFIVGSDENFFEQIPNMILQGSFPLSDTEAMITKYTSDMLNLEIGDKITINNPYGNSYTYTISGIVNATKNNLYGTVLTINALQSLCFTETNGEVSDYNSVYFVCFSNTWNVQRQIVSLKLQAGLSDEQVTENTKLLGLLGQSTNSFFQQVYAVAAVLFVLVLLSGVIMIASSLSSNVAQRTEFFGLMRCTGATPKQVMRLVHTEALNWCRYAIPVGVISGILIIWGLCFALRLLAPQYLSSMPLFSISVPSIIAGIVMGLTTVLLAARTPAKRASKVSPLVAVSGNANNVQPIKKAANVKNFKIDVALGMYHARSSRKNFVLMIASFALSIVMFLAFSVMLQFMHHALTPLYPWAADISIVSKDNSCVVNRAFIDELRNNDCIEKIYGRMFAYNVPMICDNIEQTIDLISYETNQFEWAKKYLNSGSLENIQNEKGTALYVYELQSKIQAGDTVILNVNGNSVEVKIIGILSSSPFNNAADVGTMICSEDTFRYITGQSDYTIIDMQLKKSATDEDVNYIHSVYGSGHDFIDKRADNENVKGVYYCFCIFLYGFLVLIALITVFNVINSIALSVAARTRQYGVFKAIGLSDKQLSKMIIAEASTYAVTGGITGVILGMCCNKCLFDMLIKSKWGETWSIPFIEISIIVFIMLFSVIVAVYRPIYKLHNLSIVDTINIQ